ncbi:MAG TPA: DinB family protein [Thermoanaerobaculia bacterium]|nr:DinB family protein [Thermoanaerobaculia bacterium]
MGTRTKEGTSGEATPTIQNRRAVALADRLEQGARELAEFARGLDASQWQARVPKDWRKVGVVVHHVANMYPLEIEVAGQLAAGQPVVGVTWDAVATINAAHAAEFDGVTKQAAIELLERNSAAAAAAIRELTDEELDRAAPVSLYADAPLTCQFFLEDHAVRHAFHHLARLRTTVAS